MCIRPAGFFPRRCVSAPPPLRGVRIFAVGGARAHPPLPAAAGEASGCCPHQKMVVVTDHEAPSLRFFDAHSRLQFIRLVFEALRTTFFKVIWEHVRRVKAATTPTHPYNHLRLWGPHLRCVLQFPRTRCLEFTGIVTTSFSAQIVGAILLADTHVCASARWRLTLTTLRATPRPRRCPHGSTLLCTGVTVLRVRTQAPYVAHAESASERSALCNLRPIASPRVNKFINPRSSVYPRPHPYSFPRPRPSAHADTCERPIRGLPALHPPLLPIVAAYKLIPLRPVLRVHTRPPALVVDGFTRLAAANENMLLDAENAAGASVAFHCISCPPPGGVLAPPPVEPLAELSPILTPAFSVFARRPSKLTLGILKAFGRVKAFS
ncbi:hypothetical protein DFH09DRAFT_1301233 [Mycena vulgaris]|nr:hypothetical protein DFH09DRAFT_1301233 [Mycena vulgaris]